MMASFFLTISFLFLFRFFDRNKILDALFSGACVLLAFLSHGSTLVFVPVLCIGLVIIILNTYRVSERVLWIVYFVSVATLFVGAFYVLSGIHADIKNTSLLLLTSFTPFMLLSLGSVTFLFIRDKSSKRLQIMALAILVPTGLTLLFAPQSHVRYFLPVFVLCMPFVSYAVYQIIHIGKRYIGEYSPYMVFLLLGIFTIGHFSFFPKSEYQLEFGSPQPDFKNAYKYILENISRGDIVLSPYTHLNRIYLGETGVWIPVTLLNDPSEIERKIINGREWYTGAPIVDDINVYVQDNSGFIILDSQSEGRMGVVMSEIRNNKKIILEKRFVGIKGEVVTVYRY
jgi:hypothetical protein